MASPVLENRRCHRRLYIMPHREPTDAELDRLLRQRSLISIRVLWAALLAGEGLLLVTVLLMWHRGVVPSSPPHVARAISYAGVILLVTLVPLGYFIRNQIYKRYWRGDAIAPGGYLGGNLSLYLLCEIVASASLVATMIAREHGWQWLAATPAAVAVAVHIVNFPNGKAMLPAEP
jgi:hypothetical protein